MNIHLAWHNVTHNKVRTAAIVAGISFSILLMFLQLGFYDACERNSYIIYDLYDFDAILVSPVYVAMDIHGTVPMRRLYQARTIEGVNSVMPLYIGITDWRNPETGHTYDIIVMGVDCKDRPFINEGMNDNLDMLKVSDTVLVDNKATPKYGPHETGSTVELAQRRVKIVGDYTHGAGFVCGASLIMNDLTFSKLFDGFSRQDVSVGLIKFHPDADLEHVIEGMRAVLPDDVSV